MGKFVSSTSNQPLNDLVEVVDFVFTSVNAYKEAKADGGGINLFDVPKVFDLVKPGIAAFDGIENVPGAWEAASDEEKIEVYTYFADRFDIANDLIEKAVEKGVGAALLILDVVLLLRRNASQENQA